MSLPQLGFISIMLPRSARSLSPCLLALALLAAGPGASPARANEAPIVERWEQAGGSHVSLRAMDTAAEFAGERHVGYQGPQDYIDALETFMGELR